MSAEPELKILIPRQRIKAAVDRLAAEVSADYRGKNPLLIGLLTGSFIFLADLVRKLDFPLELEFMDASSYGKETDPGEIKLIKDVSTEVDGRDVLVVDDILDTGRCASFVFDHLSRKNTSSVKQCFLLDKPERRQMQVEADYVGIQIPDKFVVGYGIDWNEKYRNLPDIYALEFQS